MTPQPPADGAPLLESLQLARIQAHLDRCVASPKDRARIAAAVRRAIAFEVTEAVAAALRGRP